MSWVSAPRNNLGIPFHLPKIVRGAFYLGGIQRDGYYGAYQGVGGMEAEEN